MQHETNVWDEFLGVSAFWTEKWLAFIVFLQDLGILWLYPSGGLPYFFYYRTRHLRLVVVDIHAHYEQMGRYFPTVNPQSFLNKLFNILFPSGVLLLWIFIAKFPLETGMKRNIERLLWLPIQLLFVPFVVNLARYGICNSDGFITDFECKVNITSLLFFFISLPALIAFPYVAYTRIYNTKCFQHQNRHEVYLRSRELEYLLRINTQFRDRRFWMSSSYLVDSIYRPVRMMGRYIILGFLICLNGMYRPEKLAAAGRDPVFTQATWDTFFCSIVLCVYFIPALHLTIRRVYRCKSTWYIQLIFGWTNVLNCLFMVMRANRVQTTALYDPSLQNSMTIYNAVALLAAAALCLFWYWQDHTVLFCRSRNGYEELEDIDLDVTTLPHPLGERFYHRKQMIMKAQEDALAIKELGAGALEGHDAEDFYKDVEDLHHDGSWYDDGKEPVDEYNRVYRRPFFEMFPSNGKHRNSWPTNQVVVDECLRENKEHKFIDSIRNARRMLDMCNRLMYTPEIISPEALMKHIRQIRQCCDKCKRLRITHHDHSIHPLQFTLESIRDDLAYEYERVIGCSFVLGKWGNKLPIVCAYLRERLDYRARVHVLVSQRMQRVLLKLLAIRMFFELVIEKKVFLRCPARRRAMAAEYNRKETERKLLDHEARQRLLLGENEDSFSMDSEDSRTRDTLSDSGSFAPKQNRYEDDASFTPSEDSRYDRRRERRNSDSRSYSSQGSYRQEKQYLDEGSDDYYEDEYEEERRR